MTTPLTGDARGRDVQGGGVALAGSGPCAATRDSSTAEQRLTHPAVGRVALVAADRGVTSPAVVVIGEAAAAGLLGTVAETDPLTRVSP